MAWCESERLCHSKAQPLVVWGQYYQQTVGVEPTAAKRASIELTTNLLLVLNTKIWVRPVWHAQKACSRSIDDDVRIHRCRCWAKTYRYVSLIQCDRLCVLSHFARRHYAWPYRFSIVRVVLHGVHHARRDIARYAHYCGNLLAADANGSI
jgi:hypothetical protein